MECDLNIILKKLERELEGWLPAQFINEEVIYSDIQVLFDEESDFKCAIGGKSTQLENIHMSWRRSRTLRPMLETEKGNFWVMNIEQSNDKENDFLLCDLAKVSI